ncbi:MAG: FKBP-type peptidyl-prolyl cis-trans isomerase N-terminal domain-containing protein, partial [Pseudomonadales bacterium]|nr:FKBP-type peptidyl-prolyl cis-trans isomerase N-terminal domain-containing protein [Pseudomonadales bacterium]
MNKTIYINILPSLLLVISTIFVSQNTLAEAAESTQPVSVDQERQATAEEMGYFFGYSFGNMLKEGGTYEVDVEALNKGMADSLSDAAPDMSPEAQAAVAVAVRAQQEEVQRMRTEMQNQISSQQKVQGEAFLVENGKKPGVITTATGL